jgi:chromate transporter
MNPFLYFWLFLKASLFTTGGTGNLPILHQDLIGLGWARESDFITAIAVGQVSPGPNGLWSISLGYLTYGWLGAGLAMVALSLPPLLILLVSAFYQRLEGAALMQDFMRGLSLGVIGLSLPVTYGLAAVAVTDWRGLIILAGALAMALTKRVPVLVILGAAGLAGYLLYGI